jgi:spermidine synthase
MPPSLILPAAFFLSGAAGLIFQVVWLYRCGLVFGSSVAAVTVVLSGFMAGLAAGNALAAVYGPRVRRNLRAYALLEAIVAATGLVVTALLPHLSSVLAPLAQAAGESSALLNVARFLLAGLLLIVPATAMGATLPLLVAALCRFGDRFGAALGRLYGWNTLGAVAGVIASEVVLIASVGVSGSARVAAVLNLCAAALVMLVRLEPESTADGVVGRRVSADRPLRVRRRKSWPLLGATALSGAVMLGLEVAWFRFLSMYVLVTTLAMSLMLAVVLTGIGAGGLLASAWVRRRADTSADLPVVACLSGLAVVGSYVAFQAVTVGTQVGAWPSVLWFACVLTLPASCLSGVLFTLVGQGLHRESDATAASAGWLTLANTAGAIGGPPVVAYLLLPRAGMERTFFVLALAYGMVALLAGLGSPRDAPATRTGWAGQGRSSGLVAAAVLLLALAAFPFGTMNSRYFLRAAAAYGDDGSRIVATREGPSETLFVMQQQWLGRPVYSRLVTNGFSMSGTALQGQRYMRAFAYYPMLLHDGPLKRALVVCYGVGVTVGAVTHIPAVEAIDVAEISRDVVAMSDAIYAQDARPLSDPRVRVHIEDGRFFLQTTRERFDLITGEPPPPRTPGTVNIYTRDYFKLVHDRLAEGGMATYWLPVGRPHPGTDVNTIARAFCDVFSDCSIWNATPFDLVLVGSRGATGPRTLEQFSAPWQTPGLEARLREVGFERPEQIGATFLGDAAYLKELTADAPPLTDDFPQRLRPVAGRPSLSDPGYGVDPEVTRMYQATLDPTRARAAFVASPLIRRFWPTALVERTLPYFDQQAIVNRVYWEGGRPLKQIEELDAVLTNTTLRTLPLWILGSDEVKQRIGETGAGTSGAVEYAHALRALSGRDYSGAARWLDAAAQRGTGGPVPRALLAYALARSGRHDLARQLAANAQPMDDDERHFWDWMRARLSN